MRPIRPVCCLLFGMICLLLTGPLAWGNPSGLNNIPTTDVVPGDILVFQTRVNLADGTQTEEFFGFKYAVPFLEGWVSLPSMGDEEVYTLKLNYVIKL